MAPTINSTMDSTIARIGRSMESRPRFIFCSRA
jgi:hypothetical protein